MLPDCVPTDVWSEVVLQLLDMRDLKALSKADARLVAQPLLSDKAVFVARRRLDIDELNWFVAFCEGDTRFALSTTVKFDRKAVARVNKKIAIDAKDHRVRSEAVAREAAKKRLWAALAVACARPKDDAATWAEVRKQHGLYHSSRLQKLVSERNKLKVQLGNCPYDGECVWETLDATPDIYDACEVEDNHASVCRYCDHFANRYVSSPLLHEVLTVYGW